MANLGTCFLGEIFLILACNRDMHKSLDESEFQPDPATDYGVSCP